MADSIELKAAKGHKGKCGTKNIAKNKTTRYHKDPKNKQIECEKLYRVNSLNEIR